MRMASPRQRISTVSSATRRWPRHDEVERALALADAALAGQEARRARGCRCSTPCRVSRGARRSSSSVVSRAIATGVASAVRRSGTPARSASAAQLRRAVEPHRDQHARQIAREQAAQRIVRAIGVSSRSRKRISLSPKISTRPGAEILVEAGQGEAGLLDVRQGDAALEAGGAGQQIEIEAGRRAARAEQRPTLTPPARQPRARSAERRRAVQIATARCGVRNTRLSPTPASGASSTTWARLTRPDDGRLARRGIGSAHGPASRRVFHRPAVACCGSCRPRRRPRAWRPARAACDRPACRQSQTTLRPATTHCADALSLSTRAELRFLCRCCQ